MTDLHQTSGQNYSSWKNLILNTLVLTVIGWFFLFMLPRFFDFADEPRKSDIEENRRTAQLSQGEKQL